MGQVKAPVCKDRSERQRATWRAQAGGAMQASGCHLSILVPGIQVLHGLQARKRNMPERLGQRGRGAPCLVLHRNQMGSKQRA